MSQQTQFQLQQIAGLLSNAQAQVTVGSFRPNVVTLVRIPCFVNNAFLPPAGGQTQFIQLVTTGVSPAAGFVQASAGSVCSMPTLCTSAAQDCQEVTFVANAAAAAVVAAAPPQQEVQQQSTRAVDSVEQQQIDLRVRNVVSMFNVCCHVNLHKLAMTTPNVIYEQSRGVVMWQLRRPSCHARISACGKVIVTGASCESAARSASRRVCRWIEQKINYRARFADYRVTNMMASCKLPFGVRLRDLAVAYPKECSYEPEITSGLIWRHKKPKMTLRVHATGSVTITGATSESNVLNVMNSLYPVLLRYKISDCPRADALFTPATIDRRLVVL